MMVWLGAERLPPESVKKLQARSIGPYMIIHKIRDNTYIVDLSKTLDVNSIFNVEDI